MYKCKKFFACDFYYLIIKNKNDKIYPFYWTLQFRSEITFCSIFIQMIPEQIMLHLADKNLNWETCLMKKFKHKKYYKQFDPLIENVKWKKI